MSRRVCIIGSGQKTVWDTNPDAPKQRARDAYRGRLFRLSLVYAEICCEDAYILSPTLGFLKLDDTLSGHKEDTRGPVKKGLVFEVARKTTHKLRVNVNDTLIVLGGLWHYEVVRSLFPQNRVVGLLRGMTLNEKARYLRDLIVGIEAGVSDCLPQGW